jgi:hypothetical protein
MTKKSKSKPNDHPTLDLGPVEPFAQPQDIRQQCGPEIGGFNRAMIDARSGRNWGKTGQGDGPGTGMTWQGKVGNKPWVVAAFTREGETLADVEALVKAQGIDGVFVVMYALSALLPEIPAPLGSAAVRLEMADVARACGLLARQGKEDKARACKSVWNALLAGERFIIRGARVNRQGRVLSIIESPLWVLGVEHFPPAFHGDMPRSVVCITLSQALKEVLAGPETAQYLNGMKELAAIPAGKPGAALARCVGLRFREISRVKRADTLAAAEALAHGKAPVTAATFTRRQWIEALGGEIETDSRRFLRFVGYWRDALKMLVSIDHLARWGEAADAYLPFAPPDKYGWFAAWCEEPIALVAGPKIVEHLNSKQGSIPVRQIARSAELIAARRASSSDPLKASKPFTDHELQARLEGLEP